MMRLGMLLIFCLGLFQLSAQEPLYLIKADRVFDGEVFHNNWVVEVKGNRIVYAGPSRRGRYDETFEFKGTLLPGLIEGHSHILLHPYNEVGWNDQVLKESVAERSARAVNHLKASLMAGVTTLRDLGSEGAGYADVGMREAVEKGVIPGPRLLVAGKALVATGSYGPKGFHEGVKVPLGAEPADGFDDLIKVTRDQIGHGIDLVKVYADYRWSPDGQAAPTFTLEELKTIVEIAESSGRYVVAHAATAEGMRRAILAGVETIEHGDGGTREVFELMKAHDVGLCPTIAAGDAIMKYFSDWVGARGNEPERIRKKRASVALAKEVGVRFVFGGDVGVFPHGENVREMELMVDYGIDVMTTLKSATAGNAEQFHLDDLGRIKEGFLADIIVVEGDPSQDISQLRKVQFVMKDGVVYKNNAK